MFPCNSSILINQNVYFCHPSWNSPPSSFLHWNIQMKPCYDDKDYNGNNNHRNNKLHSTKHFHVTGFGLVISYNVKIIFVIKYSAIYPPPSWGCCYRIVSSDLSASFMFTWLSVVSSIGLFFSQLIIVFKILSQIFILFLILLSSKKSVTVPSNPHPEHCSFLFFFLNTGPLSLIESWLLQGDLNMASLGNWYTLIVLDLKKAHVRVFS